MIFEGIIAAVFIVYLILILGLALEGHTYQPRISFFKTQNTLLNPLPLTVIVNYRNEEDHLPRLLHSIESLRYDMRLVEFLFVDDGSDDGSTKLLEAFKNNNKHLDVNLLQRVARSASAKKDGITQAVATSSYDHILCTDADCLLPPYWLQRYADFYLEHGSSHLVAGPVIIKTDGSLNGQLQSNEMLALQLVTMGSFNLRKAFMCNGANMSFTKAAFEQVGGYDGNDHISSGDDVFLLEKLLELDVECCHFLKNPEAIVTTYPKHGWSEMIQQRVRWSKKATSTKSLLNKVLSFQVLAASLSFILLPLLFLLKMIALDVIILCYGLKLLTDFLTLFLANRFFEQDKLLKYFLLSYTTYPFLVLAIAFKGITGSTSWQGRAINHLPMG